MPSSPRAPAPAPIGPASKRILIAVFVGTLVCVATALIFFEVGGPLLSLSLSLSRCGHWPPICGLPSSRQAPLLSLGGYSLVSPENCSRFSRFSVSSLSLLALSLSLSPRLFFPTPPVSWRYSLVMTRSPSYQYAMAMAQAARPGHK